MIINGLDNTDDLEVDTTYSKVIWFGMTAIDINGIEEVEKAIKLWKEENGYE